MRFWPIGEFDRQVAFLSDVLLANAALVATLRVLDEIGLPGGYVAGGAIPQIAWNHAHGFDPNHGIDDFDVVYFDPVDASAEREMEWQRAIERRLPTAPVRIEVVNEARTHLWYGNPFGREMVPYSCTEAAIATFPTTASAVGVRRIRDDFDVYAPHGLGDLLGLTVRANKVLVEREVYERKCRRWRRVWPMLTIVPWWTVVSEKE